MRRVVGWVLTDTGLLLLAVALFSPITVVWGHPWRPVPFILAGVIGYGLMRWGRWLKPPMPE